MEIAENAGGHVENARSIRKNIGLFHLSDSLSILRGFLSIIPPYSQDGDGDHLTRQTANSSADRGAIIADTRPTVMNPA